MLRTKRLVMFSVILIIIFTLFGCSQNAVTDEANNSENDVDEIEEIVKDEPQVYRLDDEERRFLISQNIEMSHYRSNRIKQRKISENTYYVIDDSTKLYKDKQMTEVVDELNRSLGVYVNKRFEEQNLAQIKYDYDNEIVGYVSIDKLVPKLSDLIRNKYSGVDYDLNIEKKNYASNPRVTVKGIYLTESTVADPNKLDSLIEMANNTKINTFVIDIKNDSGTLLYNSDVAKEYCPSAVKRPYIKDKMEQIIKKLKENDIYTIGRIVTFKSPQYAVTYPDRAITYISSGAPYKNRKGIIWASPYDRQLWEYNVELAKEVADLGFNEIQFDYVRFPATGRTLDKKLDFKNKLDENKPQAIHNFLKFAYEELSAKEVYVSADIFGWAASSISDEGIGQHWEALVTTIDYSSPMIYPSHYGPGNFGLDVPDKYPYKTVSRSIQDAINRNENVKNPAVLRPWIQDFTAPWINGHISYGNAEVKQQIQALEDNGVDQYLLWSPSNRYSWQAVK